MKKATSNGIKHGYRSGLEKRIDAQLVDWDVDFTYEATTFKYDKPARTSRYTPDFILPNGIIIESKGRFVTADRQKHILIKDQHPDLDLRFVFSNPNNRISKTSQTTYAMWCDKHGFKYKATPVRRTDTIIVPMEWISEPVNQRSLDAIATLGV